MIVYHPARTTFAELYEKWDRHIDHDAADYERVRFGRLRWAAYAIAVALSPALELPRILRIETRVDYARPVDGRNCAGTHPAVSNQRYDFSRSPARRGP